MSSWAEATYVVQEMRKDALQIFVARRNPLSETLQPITNVKVHKRGIWFILEDDVVNTSEIEGDVNVTGTVGTAAVKNI